MATGGAPSRRRARGGRCARGAARRRHRRPGRRARRRCAGRGRVPPAPRDESPGRSRRSPPAACARLRITTPPAPAVSDQRRARSGTSRCGITLVNHEPGPSTHPVGARRRPRPPRGRPAGRPARARTARDPAAASWRPRPGRGLTASSAPTGRRRGADRPRRASISSGTAAIGSTRPRAPEQARRPSRARRRCRRAAPTARR